jgi:two-component system chemotaxis sensor kinase CheA
MSENGDSSQYYKEEAKELLQSIEQQLVELEENPQEAELIHGIFRAFHTLKGSGSMFGFEEVADFTHEVETLFDSLRDGKLELSKEIIDTALEAKDYIGELIFDPDACDRSQGAELKGRIERMMGKEGPAAAAGADEAGAAGGGTEEGAAEGVSEGGESPDASAEEAEEGETCIYRIRFAPNPDFFLRGAKVLPIFHELEELGTCAVFSHIERIPPFDEQCLTEWTIILSTDRGENAIRDVFMFVEDYSDIRIEIIDEESRIDIDEEYKRIGEILYEQGRISREDIQAIVERKTRFGDLAVKEGLISSNSIESALQEQKFVREARKKRKEQQESSTIRVKSEKLDNLVNLVGELVTLQARLSQYSEREHIQVGNERNEIEVMNETLDRLTADLRDTTMDIRMVPLAETFNTFQRLVRDLSSELGKEVSLETTGAETELDKNIIDELKDPLVHVIRNSIDHGIESPEEREQLGKPRRGTLKIHAEHSGGQVIITIEDDGAGIDLEKVRSRAAARGLISGDESLSERDLVSLIFNPGFSTTENATSVSGRGVGMDVVKKHIEKLRGKVDIDTEKGRGSTISLTIPLTLSIIDGLLIALGEERYVVNLSTVDECFEYTAELRKNVGKDRYLNVREEIVPYIDLRELFEMEATNGEIRELVVVSVNEQKVALIVDKILGQHQTVIKPMSSAFKQVEEISGSTILGDGSIAFILDVNKMMERAYA